MTLDTHDGPADPAPVPGDRALANAAPKRLTILGATGSIGQSTLDLVRRHRDRFVVEAVTAANNVETLAAIAHEVNARMAVVANPDHYTALREALAGTGIEAGAGAPAVVEAASRPADLVMAGIVGSAGLAPSLAAIRNGATLALANKETLVCAGDLVMAELAKHGGHILPVDSEHNAIHQVLDRTRPETVASITLTASGGPLRTWSREALGHVTPEQAVAHPNWSMGAKISVDSATMMNKGLELIEAHHLFAMPEARINVLVHPESIIHSMVTYRDGSVLAELGNPDMRTPIAYALAWPTRMDAHVTPLDLGRLGRLTFEPPDPERFPSLRLAREALQTGGTAPTILNAANEVAVAAFLEGRIGYPDIFGTVEATLSGATIKSVTTLDDVGEVDREARAVAEVEAARRAG
jgi:1-deoxy-D-xylulose-5-phosphate reductoisomerase